MNSNKGFVHLLLLIVVVLVGIGGLLYFSWQKGLIKTSPTKEAFPTPTMVINETANLSRDDILRNWKTYTNTKYSYSLKYPLELTYNENSNGDVSFFLLGDDQRKDTPNGLGQHLSIVHRRESPNEAVKFELPNVSIKPFEINNAKGIQVIEADFDYYLTPKLDTNLTLRLTFLPDMNISSSDEAEKMLNIFNQILSTFKFIEFKDEIKTTNETTNWKTYVGQEYSIKYPSAELLSKTLGEDKSIELTFYNISSTVKTESIKILVSKEPTTYKSIFEMESPFSSYIKIGEYSTLVIFPDTDPPDFCGTYNLINKGELYTLYAYNPNSPHGGNCDNTYLRQILSTLQFLE